MLTQAFNGRVGFQAQAQAVLREKTLEHEQHHFNHTLKGHDFVIPKNAAIGVADGGKLTFKKDEKFRKLFDHINRMHQIMKEAKAMMDSIYADIEEYQESVDRQNRLRQHVQDGDIDKLRDMFINEYDMDAEDVANMSDEEVLATADKLDDVEQSKQDMLIESIKLKIRDFEQYIENGNLPESKKEELQQALDKIKQDAQKETGVNYDKAYNEAWEQNQEHDTLYDAGREIKSSAKSSETKVKALDEVEESNSTSPTPNLGGFDI